MFAQRGLKNTAPTNAIIVVISVTELLEMNVTVRYLQINVAPFSWTPLLCQISGCIGSIALREPYQSRRAATLKVIKPLPKQEER